MIRNGRTRQRARGVRSPAPWKRSEQRRRRRPSCRRLGYVLLETVVATGMLVVGLAVLGAQVQDSHTAIRTMERRIRAIMLAEQQLAELEMGLIELDSVDELEEGDFGPRYPNFGWLLTTEETVIEGMYLLRLDILHILREEEYREDTFDHDHAEPLYTVYAMKAAPKPVHFGEDFGLSEEEQIDLCEKLAELGIAGIDCEAFPLDFFRDIPFDKLIESAPLLMGAFNINIDDVLSTLPPDVMRQIQDSGLLDELAGEENDENPGGGEGDQ